MLRSRGRRWMGPDGGCRCLAIAKSERGSRDWRCTFIAAGMLVSAVRGINLDSTLAEVEKMGDHRFRDCDPPR